MTARCFRASPFDSRRETGCSVHFKVTQLAGQSGVVFRASSKPFAEVERGLCLDTDHSGCTSGERPQGSCCGLALTKNGRPHFMSLVVGLHGLLEVQNLKVRRPGEVRVLGPDSDDGLGQGESRRCPHGLMMAPRLHNVWTPGGRHLGAPGARVGQQWPADHGPDPLRSPPTGPRPATTSPWVA